MQTIRVGIIGASGYSGLELTKLLGRHPGVALSFATSDRWVGQPVAERTGTHASQNYVSVEVGLEQAEGCQVVFLATPAESSLELAPKLLARGAVVIDLAGSFRLKDLSLYPPFYKFEHPAPELVSRATYGLPELFREDFKAVQLVANPGCYATAAALSVAPLLKAGLIEVSSVVINAASGVSGAGRKVSEDFTFMEVEGDFRAYRTLNHQHVPEIRQTLSRVAGTDVTVVFTPHLLPMKRGILSTAVARLRGGVTQGQVAEAFQASYAKEPLITLLKGADQVRIADVAHTARALIGATSDGHHVVSVCAIDNLLKGAASQAVQNMNLRFGFRETEGLL